MKRFTPLLVLAAAAIGGAQQMALALHLTSSFAANAFDTHTNVIVHGANGDYAIGGHTLGTPHVAWILQRDAAFGYIREFALNPTPASIMGPPILANSTLNDYYVGAEIKGNATANKNAWLQGRNIDGTIRWTRQIDVAAGSDDVPSIVRHDFSSNFGNVYIAGNSTKNGITRWFVAKYNSQGAFQFVKTGENDSSLTGMSMLHAPWDPVITYQVRVGNNYQNRIARLSSTDGANLWRTGYNPNFGQGQDAFFHGVEVVAGQLVAVGSTGVAGVPRPMFAVFNATNGLRTAQNVSATARGSYYQLHPQMGSSFYATGHQSSSGTGLISSYNDTGSGGFVYWSRKFSPSANDIVSCSDSTTDAFGNLYVLGHSYSPVSGPPGRGTLCVRYLSNGTARWTFNHRAMDTLRYPSSLLVHPTRGQVVIAGQEEASGGDAMLTLLNQAAVATVKGFMGQRNVILSGYAGQNDENALGGTFNLVVNPAVGSVNLSTNGQFEFTPPPDWTGETYFTYTVSRSGVSTSNQGRVNITITP